VAAKDGTAEDGVWLTDRVDGISFTVHPGASNTVGSERPAGSNPAGGERRVAWAGVRLHQLGPVYSRGPESSEATRRRLSRPAFAPVATVAVGSVDWGHRTAEGAVMLGPAVD